MRFKILKFTDDQLEDLGLIGFQSKSLNSVIALVVKNGSGKTRYLQAIQKKLENISVADNLHELFEFIPSNIAQLAEASSKNFETYSLLKQLQELQKQRSGISQTEKAQKIQVLSRQFQIANTKNPINTDQIDEIENTIRKEIRNRVKIINPSELRALKERFDSTDKVKVSFQDIIDSTTENIEVNEFSMITESALTYLQRLPHKLALDDIQTRGDEKKFKGRVSYKRYTLLKKLLQEFLGKNLEWESQSSDVAEHDDHIAIKTAGFWKINGRAFNYNHFSEGEKVLFTYAILLFLLNTNSNIKFKQSIIIIDEPELNLHPKAQIKLIQTLKDLIEEEGQLIIATHSLSIVANLQYGDIFLVRDSKMYTPSSTVPFNAVDDLMGFEEHYNKIVEFLISTPAWAMTNFMSQCFADPEVINSANNNDPQLEMFKSQLLERKNLKILDFGSGKGRLLEKLRESDETWQRIQVYNCFDIVAEYNTDILRKGAKKIYNDLALLEESYYDIIILVNVLHEIHPQYWVQTLNKLKKSLAPDGFLTIIEDLELPIGELPNDIGFLLLSRSEMRTLLGENSTFFSPESSRYKDRILCSVISKIKMNEIDNAILKRTFEELKRNSLQDIKNFRETNDNRDLKLGRLYALKSNSYVNSELALQYLKKK